MQHRAMLFSISVTIPHARSEHHCKHGPRCFVSRHRVKARVRALQAEPTTHPGLNKQLEDAVRVGAGSAGGVGTGIWCPVVVPGAQCGWVPGQPVAWVPVYGALWWCLGRSAGGCRVSRWRGYRYMVPCGGAWGAVRVGAGSAGGVGTGIWCPVVVPGAQCGWVPGQPLVWVCAK